MVCDYYNLPDITIIGGDTFPIHFDLFRDRKHTIPFEMGGRFVAYFSMVEFLNRESAVPTLAFSSVDQNARVSVTQDEDDTYNNVVVQFQAIDTVYLSGKYIYQLTLEEFDGATNESKGKEVLGQGTMTIIRNIHPSLFISGGTAE